MGERFAKHAGDNRFDTMSFLQSRERTDFPAWWTSYPVRAPLLVGWRGGPGAFAMARLTHDEIIAAAIGSLAKLLGMTRSAVRRHVVAAYMHDWINDPFARGAYSYVRVG